VSAVERSAANRPSEKKQRHGRLISAGLLVLFLIRASAVFLWGA
jgi:hypothetical protein